MSRSSGSGTVETVPVKRFPDPKQAGPEGLVALGGDLHPRSLLLAYRQGIFPWPIEGLPLTWFCPAERAILDFADLKIPRSLVKLQRRAPYRLTIDAAFGAVIEDCAAARRPDPDGSGSGTWITAEMRRAYCDFHRLGHAHSVEAWDGKQLAGGLYGVDVDGAFVGESMFYHQPNASKLALLHLIEHLSRRRLDWIDVQVMSPHLAAFGAKLIDRDCFLKRLAETRSRGLKLFYWGGFS